MRPATVETAAGKFAQAVTIGPHHFVADEPREDAGDDTGPAPHDFLLAALGSCTSMTVKLYADRKQWPLQSVRVELTQEKQDGTHVIHRTVHLEGPLTDEQRARLLDIANKCPVHKTLTHPIQIQTALDGK